MNVSFRIVFIGWTLLIFSLCVWNYKSVYNEAAQLARREAYEGYQKDIMYRDWATIHGGVYVPVTKETQPNPYLADHPERDLVTPSKKELTLLNPAYITRQVEELTFKKTGIRGHITSLKPIRKENSADKWETEALKQFEKGSKEIYGFDIINNEKYFRYMAPIITEKKCLLCHASQGYKVGQVRGGLSSSIPWAVYEATIISQTTRIYFGFGILWIIGLAGISLVKKKFVIYISKRDNAEEEMKNLNRELTVTKNLIENNLKERDNFIEEITGVNEELKKTNQEKDKFFSIIAHDLKAPFSGLMELTAIISENPDTFSKEDLSRLHKEIHFSTKTLFKLLQNLLEWSQMKKGLVEYAPSKLNLSEIIEQNLDLIKYKLEKKSITVENAVDDSLFVFADENMLNSVVRNLLSNASKFSNKGGAIFTGAKTLPHGFVQLEVRDYGIGMAPELKEKLFKIEEKVGRKGTDGERSTGLGLLLCKEFTERHGGIISVESSEGTGSSFFVTIPSYKD